MAQPDTLPLVTAMTGLARGNLIGNWRRGWWTVYARFGEQSGLWRAVLTDAVCVEDPMEAGRMPQDENGAPMRCVKGREEEGISPTALTIAGPVL